MERDEIENTVLENDRSKSRVEISRARVILRRGGSLEWLLAGDD